MSAAARRNPRQLLTINAIHMEDLTMANIPNSNDPSRPTPVQDDPRRPQQFGNKMQPEPHLAEPASGSRVALYALGAAVLLGIVFYGLNQNSTTTTATSTAPVTQSGTQKAPTPTNNIADSNSNSPVAPPGVRDVTPRNNDAPAVTTGAATRPQSAPTGTEVDRSKAGTSK
jgi:cytoskeletal protein RodZ